MKERIIYVVTSGQYSDYHINGVFDDKALAEAFIAAFDGQYRYDEMEIEEYPVNVGGREAAKKLRPFSVIMDRDGTAREVKIWDTAFTMTEVIEMAPAYNGAIRVLCWAKDDRHAVKIANERRVHRIAMEVFQPNTDA